MELELDLEEVARPIPMPMPYAQPLHPSQSALKRPQNQHYIPPSHSSGNNNNNKKSTVKPPINPQRSQRPLSASKSTSSSRISMPPQQPVPNKSDRSMRNPEKLVYLMRAGHNARSTSPAQPRNASAPAPVAIPAYQLNSTAHLQRQADAIAAEVFEEDNDEVLAEFERRAKQSEFKPRKNVVDFAPTEQRYTNLIPLDTGTPLVEAVPRKVVKPPPPPSQHSTSRPSITGPCFENEWDDYHTKLGEERKRRGEKRNGVATRSVYVQPMTTPSIDTTVYPSLHYYLKGNPSGM